MITVDEGGNFKGNCVMKDQKTSSKKKKDIPPEASITESITNEAKKEK